MGIFSFVGGLLGGRAAKKGSKKAMQAQVAAMEKGIAEQQRQYDLTRADFEPFRATGVKALGGLGDLTGTNGAGAQQAAIDALRASPFYQSLFANGQESLLQTAAATGGLRGGNTQGALADFGRDTLMQTIERQLASLGGLAGMGMGATEAVGNFGANKAGAVTNLLVGQGQARAANHLTRAGINAGMWKSAGNFLDDVVGAAVGAGAGPGGAPFNLSKFLGSF